MTQLAFERMVERRYRSTPASRRAGRLRGYRESEDTADFYLSPVSKDMPYNAKLKSNLPKPPPATLYHVTLFANEILSRGFLLPSKAKVSVLGGSTDAVSFTDDLTFAKMYANGMQVAIEAAKPNFRADEPQEWAVLLRQYKFNPYPVTTDILPKVLKDREKYRWPNRKVAFEVLQQYSFWTRKFPLFMGGSFPDAILKADSMDVTILAIDSEGPQWWGYNPHEREFRIFDPENIRDIRIVQ